MRELKFRVWSEDQKTYNYQFPYNKLGQFYISENGKVFSDFGNTVAPEVRQEAFVVEQYTGLKDKNGKEIYEGDIVKLYDRRRLVSTCVVSYDELNGEYIWNSDLDNTPLYGGFPVWAKYLVIGNIHENPDLLKEKGDK